MRVEQSVLAAFLTTLVFGLGLTLAAEAAPKHATGEVLAVDAGAATVTVRVPAPVTSSPTDLVLRIDGGTKIDSGGKAIGLAELKKGDKVTVAYLMRDGKPVATSIAVDQG